MLINLCRNLEGAIHNKTEGVSADQGVAACNDTDQLLDCLRLEMRQRGEDTVALNPVIRRLTKIKAHYLAEVGHWVNHWIRVTKFLKIKAQSSISATEKFSIRPYNVSMQLTGDWRQQVRWQKSEYPRRHQLVISSEAGRTFALLNGLRNSSALTTDLLGRFIENIVRPVINDQCVVALFEKSALVQLEATIVDRADEAKGTLHSNTINDDIEGVRNTVFSVGGLNE